MNELTLREVYKQMRTYFSRPDAVLAKGDYDEPGEGICMYRTWDGEKCAVGSIIPDANYRPYFEGLAAAKLIEILGQMAEGQVTVAPLEFTKNGADVESLEDYASIEDEEVRWYRPEEEAENAKVLHLILDNDPDKIAFLAAAQQIHDNEAYNAADFVSRLGSLAREKGVIL